MSKPAIIEGTFAEVPATNCTRQWVGDNGDVTGHVYQRVTGAAAVTVSGRIVEVYLTRAHAERGVDPAYQAALAQAKRRSGADWA